MKKEITLRASPRLNLVEQLKRSSLDEPLKSWLPLGVKPLHPCTSKFKEDYTVHVAFALETASDKASEPTLTPWGVVSWLYSNGKVLSLQNVSIRRDAPRFHFSKDDICRPSTCQLFDNSGSPHFLGSENLELYYKDVLSYLGWAPDLYSSSNPKENSESNISISTSTEDLSNANSPPVDEPLNKQPASKIEVAQARRKDLAHTFIEAMELSKDIKILDLEQGFKSIQTIMSNDKFKVVIAGEFSRGKSTLLNRLLGKEVLPVGDLPTTAALTSIVYGRETRFIFVKPNQELLVHSSLDRLWESIQIDYDDDDDVIKGSAQISLPLDWLATNRLELIDTPGVGELNEYRASLSLNAIASCDATIIVISATMPLSMTERSFLEHKILISAIPKVSVVVTKLDLVAETDRLKVLNHIVKRVHEIDDTIQIWTTYDGTDYEVTNTFGISGIRSKILEWSTDLNHFDLVSTRIHKILRTMATQLRSSVDKLEIALVDRINGQQVDAEAQLKALELTSRDWDKFDHVIHQAQQNLHAKLVNIVNQNFSKTIVYLHEQVDAAPNLKRWIERDAKIVIQQRLQELSEGLSGFVRKSITSDYRLICDRIMSEFQSTSNNQDLDLASTALTEQSLIYLERFEANNPTLNKLGYGVGAFLLPKILLAGMGPIGMLVSLGLAFGGRLLANQSENDEREKVRAEVSKSMDMAKLEILSNLRQLIDRVYNEISSDLQMMRSSWITEKRVIIQKACRSQFPEEDFEALSIQKMRLSQIERKLSEL